MGGWYMGWDKVGHLSWDATHKGTLADDMGQLSQASTISHQLPLCVCVWGWCMGHVQNIGQRQTSSPSWGFYRHFFGHNHWVLFPEGLYTTKEITRGQVRTVMWVGNQVYVVLSQECNRDVRSVRDGIILQENKVSVTSRPTPPVHIPGLWCLILSFNFSSNSVQYSSSKYWLILGQEIASSIPQLSKDTVTIVLLLIWSASPWWAFGFLSWSIDTIPACFPVRTPTPKPHPLWWPSPDTEGQSGPAAGCRQTASSCDFLARRSTHRDKFTGHFGYFLDYSLHRWLREIDILRQLLQYLASIFIQKSLAPCDSLCWVDHCASCRGCPHHQLWTSGTERGTWALERTLFPYCLQRSPCVDRCEPDLWQNLMFALCSRHVCGPTDSRSNDRSIAFIIGRLWKLKCRDQLQVNFQATCRSAHRL